MRYRLLTLGQTGVTAGGAPVDFPVGKPFGILVYLAQSGDPVPREDLAALFWPTGDRTRARHSLRQALSFLRQQLGEDVFTSDDPTALDPSRVGSDVEDLREALEAGSVDRILELYRGPFLATFQLPGSPAWDHWVESERRVVEERVARSLRSAAEEAATPERAEALLRRVVAIEPHRIRHRSALLDRLLEQGDLEAAAAVLAEARQAEVDDVDETLAAMESRLRAVRERRAARGDPGDLHPEFVGRSAELASLTASWRQAMRGRRQIAILSGPTGIGKTRLAEELTAVAAATGRVVHLKASPVERRLDWSVTAQLARALYRLPGAAGIGTGAETVLRSLVPTLGGSDAPARAVPRPVAVSDALVDLVSAVAYETPLLIVLDDIQWVDRSSLALLMRMARNVRGEPVMIVLTFRSEELDAREQTSIRALADEEGAVVMRLRTLSEGEVGELLALSGLQEPERIERLARRLHDVTRGHPLFLVELLRSLRDDGVLVRAGEGWRLHGPAPLELELPVSVRLVIEKRLDQLSEDARRVGAELAGQPPSAELERIRARTGLSDAAFTGTLNELLERAVVTWDASGRLTFAHDQLRAAMAGGRRRRVGRGWLVAAVAGLLVVVLTAALLLRGSESPRYGGGYIVAWVGDSIVAVDPQRPDESAPAPVWYPRTPDIHSVPRARRLPDGRIVWAGATQDLVEAPDGAVFTGPGERISLDWPGDDYVTDVSPDGRFAAWVTENHTTPDYDLDLRIRRLQDDGDRRVAGPAGGINALWAPGGTRLAVKLRLANDSLLVMSPRGDRLLERSHFMIYLEDWCGPDHVLLLVQDSPESARRRLLIDVARDTHVVLDTMGLPGARCSPDGSAYAGLTRSDGWLTPTITEIGTGRRAPMGVPDSHLARAQWIRTTAPPAPQAVEVAADTLRVARGGTHPLEARLRMSDGTVREPAVTWRSTDPAVASMLADGTTLVANRPGRAKVVAEYARWLADTAEVVVETSPAESLVLADDFRGLQRVHWQKVGQPSVAPARVGGRDVLELLGDGRYRDGIISRTARPHPGGATIELELQLPLTANAYQGFRFCLLSADPPGDEARVRFEAWALRQELCMHTPAHELAKWRPDLVRLDFNPIIEVARLPDGTDLGTWTHVAIQVQADGLASLWIDRERVASLRTPAAFLDRPLRVGIFGRTRGTRGYVRNLAWWSEPRFR